MQNEYSVIARGAIWHVAYYTIEDSDLPPYVCCPHQSAYGGIQKGGPDPVMNYQIIMVWKITSTQGDQSCRIHVEMNYMSIIDNKGHSKNLYYCWI